METILILAQALAKAGNTDIKRLDIQYSDIRDSYYGYTVIACDGKDLEYCIRETGEIEIIE